MWKIDKRKTKVTTEDWVGQLLCSWGNVVVAWVTVVAVESQEVKPVGLDRLEEYARIKDDPN